MQSYKQVIFFFFIFYSIFMAQANAYTMDGIADEMNFLSKRSAILSQNIANIDTPNYVPKDIIKHRNSQQELHINRTHIAHFSLNEDSSPYSIIHGKEIEIKPNGNKVNLSYELMEKDAISMRYKELSTIHKLSKSLLRTATKTPAK